MDPLRKFLNENRINEPNVYEQLSSCMITPEIIVNSHEDDLRALCQELKFSATVRTKLLFSPKKFKQSQSQSQSHNESHMNWSGFSEIGVGRVRNANSFPVEIEFDERNEIEAAMMAMATEEMALSVSRTNLNNISSGNNHNNNRSRYEDLRFEDNRLDDMPYRNQNFEEENIVPNQIETDEDYALRLQQEETISYDRRRIGDTYAERPSDEHYASQLQYEEETNPSIRIAQQRAAAPAPAPPVPQLPHVNVNNEEESLAYAIQLQEEENSSLLHQRHNELGNANANANANAIANENEEEEEEKKSPVGRRQELEADQNIAHSLAEDVGSDAASIPQTCVSREQFETFRRNDISCRICMEEFATGELLKTLPTCACHFHAGCIDKWIASRQREYPQRPVECPIDRAIIIQPQI